MTIKNCPKCNKEFDDYSKWGAKKFCSRSCANSKEQTQLMRDKKAKKLSIVGSCKFCDKECASKGALKNHERSCLSNPNRLSGYFSGKNHSFDAKNKQGQKNSMGLKVPASILDMSKRTATKILLRIGKGCSNCGWNESSCDLHHILPRSKGGSDLNENLTVLCPNCHRLAHTKKLKTFVSLTSQIGEVWRDFYYAHK